jgi:cytoskeletal protein CcmA (bactofilin family)
MGLFGREENAQKAADVEPARPPRPEATSGPQEPGDRTIVAHSVCVEGTLAGSGEIIVHGKVKGAIEGSGSVHVAARGEVTASIHGRSVRVTGTVKGNISADERIELEPASRVEGDITAPRILIKDGATFVGQVNMRSPHAKPSHKDAAGDAASRKGP